MGSQLGENRRATLKGHKGPIHALLYSSGSGQYLLSASGDRSVHLWNPDRASVAPTQHDPNPPLIQSYHGGHNQDVLDVSVSNDNARFVSAGGDKSIVQWDTASAQVVRRYGGLHGHRGPVNSVHIAGHQDSVIVSGGYDKTVRLWDCKSNSPRPIQVFDHATDAITAIAVADTEIIAGGNDGKVRSYDLRAGQVSEDVIGESISSLALSPDSDALLVATADSTIRLFDRSNGRLLMSYKDTDFVSRNYRIKSTLACEGSLVLSGSESGTIFGWNLLSGLAKHRVKHHDDAGLVTSLGRRAVTAVASKNPGTDWASGAGDGLSDVRGSEKHLASLHENGGSRLCRNLCLDGGKRPDSYIKLTSISA